MRLQHEDTGPADVAGPQANKESSMLQTRTTRLIVIAAAMVAGGLQAAQAQSSASSPLYGSLSLGAPLWRDNVNSVPTDEHGLAGKLALGYSFTPNFSLEGGALNLGRINDSSTGASVHAHGVFVDAVGTWAIAPQWSVLGRAGLVNAGFTSNDGTHDRGTGLRAGLGLQYELNRNVALRGEYERNHLNKVLGGNPDVDQFSLGVKVGF